MRIRPQLVLGTPLLAWLLLTAISTATHVLAWNRSLGADPASGGEWPLKGLNNIFDTAAIPAWFVLWRLFGRHNGFLVVGLINALTWGACVVVVVGLLRLRRRLGAKKGPALDNLPESNGAPLIPGRRKFLLDASLVSGSLGFCGLGAAASVFTPWSLVLRRYSVPIRGLPGSLDGLRLVHLTDTHLGPRIPAGFISRAVDLALSLEPDLFVLTGDYVHDGVAYIDRAASLFDPLICSGGNCIGVVGVLGNHDHYADAPAVSAAMRSRGVRMIDNDRLFIDGATRRLVGRAPSGGSLCIAGVDDLVEGIVRPDLALMGVGADVPRILLAHNPDTAEIPAFSGAYTPSERIDLMLSGHTHGGQVRFPIIGAPVTLSRYGQKYVHGLVRGPSFPVVISAGIGMSVFPVRFGVPPEVVEITLVRA